MIGRGHDGAELRRISTDNRRISTDNSGIGVPVAMETKTAGAGVRVLVVDHAGGTLAAMLKASGQVAEVYVESDAITALRLLQSIDIDAVLAALDLPGFDGLDLARILQQFAKRPAVTLLAQDGSRAAEAFEVGAVDYLVRPVNAPRLVESLQRIPITRQRAAALAPVPTPVEKAAARPAADETVLASLGGATTRIARSSVRWMEADHGYTRLHTGSGSHAVAASLVNLSTAWADDGIIQIHRTYAVRMSAVSELRKVGGQLAVVVDGRELPVSRRYGQRVRHLLMSARPVRKLIPRQQLPQPMAPRMVAV
jgi:DNA-binding LytR/AlgR family response regulator